MPGKTRKRLDDLDRALLRLLRANARESVTALARRLRVSRATVQLRMERLSDKGVIQGYTVRYDPRYERDLVRAHVSISVLPRNAIRAEKALRALPELEALYSVSGNYDLIAVVAAESVERLDQVIDAIGAAEAIERTNTAVILSTKFVR